MPLVFVHGATLRRSPVKGAEDPYQRRCERRDNLFRRFALQSLSDHPEDVTILNPYWGDHGATFFWNHASMAGIDQFGIDDEVLSQLLFTFLGEEMPDADAGILTVARTSMEAAVDLLWATMGDAPSADEQHDVDTLAFDAINYAQHNPRPAWLSDVKNDDQFLQAFINAVNDWRSADGTGPGKIRLRSAVRSLRSPTQAWSKLKEGAARMNNVTSNVVVRRFAQAIENQSRTLGPGLPPNAWLKIGEGAERIRSAARHVVTRRILRTYRASINRQITGFLGDVFQYLETRGTVQEPGGIVLDVIADLEKAIALAKNPEDSKVIIIAHSLGGIITYDILTYFRPDLYADVFVTVGSQVSLFEELKLLKKRDLTVPTDLTVDRMPKPANIGRWLNILDHCDVLAYATSGVFDDTRDLTYSTGRGLVLSHTAYFDFPSFHRRLADWMREEAEA